MPDQTANSPNPSSTPLDTSLAIDSGDLDGFILTASEKSTGTAPLPDDLMVIVRRNAEREEERQREHRQTMKQHFVHLGAWEDSLSQSKVAICLGLVPSAFWILRMMIVVGNPYRTIPLFLVGTGAILLMACFGPFVAAGVACLWFRQSPKIACNHAIAIGLLLDAAFMGWVILLSPILVG